MSVRADGLWTMWQRASLSVIRPSYSRASVRPRVASIHAPRPTRKVAEIATPYTWMSSVSISILLHISAPEYTIQTAIYHTRFISYNFISTYNDIMNVTLFNYGIQGTCIKRIYCDCMHSPLTTFQYFNLITCYANNWFNSLIK